MAMTEEEQRRYNEALLESIQALAGLSRESMVLAAQEKAAAEAAARQKAKFDAVSGAAENLAKSFVSYNRAIYDGQSANQAAAAAATDMAEAAKFAGVALALLIPGGPLIKGLVAGLGLLTSKLIESSKLIAEQTDAVYKNYQELAKAGATGAGAMNDAAEAMFKVGLGSKQFGEVVRLFNENAQEMAYFGGSVMRGRKIFERTMDTLSNEQRVQMQQMGMDRTAQSEAAMGYIKQQRLLTQGSKAQMDTSSAAVMRYVKETDLLTRITGLNRQQQEKVLEDAMRDQAFNATLRQIEREQGEAQAKLVRNTLILYNSIDPEIGNQFKDSLSGFVSSSNNSGKALLATGGTMQEFTQKLRTGQIRDLEAVSAETGRVFNSYRDTVTQYETLAQAGVFDDAFGVFSGLARAAGVTEGQISAAAFRAAQAEQDAQLKSEATRKAAETEEAARRTQIANDRTLLATAQKAYLDANHSVALNNEKLAAAALKAANALNKVAEAGQPRAPQTAMPGSLPTAAQAQQDVKKAEFDLEQRRKERQTLQSDIDRLDTQLAQAKDKKNQEEVKKLESEKSDALKKQTDARLAEYNARQEALRARAREGTARAMESRLFGTTGIRPAPAAPPRSAAPAAGPMTTASVDYSAAGAMTTGATPAAPAAPAAGPMTTASVDYSAAGAMTTGAMITGAAPAAAPPSGGAAPAPSGGPGLSTGDFTRTDKGGREPESSGRGAAVGAGARDFARVSGAKVSEKPIAEVVAAGPGFTTVKTTDGDTQRRQGVRNWRNNNPGNIEFKGGFSERHGAVGHDGRFAVFPTLEAGMKAKETLLFGEKSRYKDLSIEAAINRYAPPNENPTEAYINTVLQSLGVPGSTVLSTLNSGQRRTFLEAISRVEGFKEGKILQAAEGGVIMPKQGGTLVQVAEAGKPEAIIPLKNGSVPVDMNTDGLVGSLRSVLSDLRSTMGEMTTTMRVLPILTEESLKVLRNIESTAKTSTAIQDRLLSYAQN